MKHTLLEPREARRPPAAALTAASAQPVLSTALVIEHESNREILEAIDHAHQQLVAAEIAELVEIIRAADRWEIDHEAVGAGIERLIQPGHDGTPQVAEFLALELGALLGVSQKTALGRIGDALDLRHRHPELWEAVLAGSVRVWQAMKICFECSHLAYRAARKVDAAIATSVGMLPWVRVMKALPGQIIQADPDLAMQREQGRRDSRRIRVSPIEDGHVNLFGVVDAADGIKFNEVLNHVATLFSAKPDTALLRDVDRRRSLAFGIITQNAYNGLANDQPGFALPSPTQVGASSPADTVVRKPIDCTLIVHISSDDPALSANESSSATGVARVEGWGPLLTARLPEFLAGAKVNLRPIIDPAGLRPVDCYETPTKMRFALEQRNPVDIFPYATTKASNCDADHTVAYVKGRPGQTRLGNLGPVSRKAHRAKTHGKWTLSQPTPGVYHWTSPHGYRYTVTAAGAIRITTPEPEADCYSSAR